MHPADRPRAREGIVVRPVARLLLSAVLGGAAIFIGSPVTAATGYTVTDVGTLGGEWSDAQGINEAGDIAGTASRSTAGSAAYRWKGGLMTAINSFGGLSSQGLAISDDGWVVGSAPDRRAIGRCHRAGRGLPLGGRHDVRPRQPRPQHVQ
jgi:hypothetical protein